MISALENGEGGMAPGVSVKPIFLTLSNVDSATAQFDFESFDDVGNMISSGSFTLSDPISGVRETGDGGTTPVAMLNVMPNPAGTSATVSLTLSRSLNASTMTITDLAGRVIKTLVSGPLDQGNHIIQTDVHDMGQGTYFIVLNTPFGTQSLPLNVVK